MSNDLVVWLPKLIPYLTQEMKWLPVPPTRFWVRIDQFWVKVLVPSMEGDRFACRCNALLSIFGVAAHGT